MGRGNPPPLSPDRELVEVFVFAAPEQMSAVYSFLIGVPEESLAKLREVARQDVEIDLTKVPVLKAVVHHQYGSFEDKAAALDVRRSGHGEMTEAIRKVRR